MNKLINWLLQPTQNGATYLQVLIVGALMCVVLHLFFKNIKEVIDIERKDTGEDE